MKTDLEKANELQTYYKRIAEEQRARCLAIEREINLAKHTHDFEIEKVRNEANQIKNSLEDRLEFERNEAARQLSQITVEKQQEVNEMFTDNTHLAHRLNEAENRNEEHEKQKIAITKERDNYLEKLAEAKRDSCFNLSQT